MVSVLLASAAVVLLSALCSLSEAAFLSLPIVRARALAKLGGRTARVVLRLRENVQNAITAIVMLNTIVNVVGTYLVTTHAAKVAEEASRRGDLLEVSGAWITALLTVAVVIFGEIFPKSVGERLHVGVSLAAAYPVLALITAFHPLVWISEIVVDRLVPRRRGNVSAKEEIEALAEEAGKEGVIGSRQAEVIQRVFRLNDITSEDVMTPRIRCHMLPGDTTVEEARAELNRVQASRVPLFAGTRDHIVGVLRRADALRALADGKGAARLADLASKAKFVPAAMTVDRLLFEFQRERVQIAIVVGEYGETMGLVTLEDVMEELVGEILDEKDVDERTIKRVSREEILVHGQTEISRINRFFNTDLPEDRPTIAGLVLERLGRFPRPGEHCVTDGVDIVVDESSEKAIVRVRILKDPAGAREPADRPASLP